VIFLIFLSLILYLLLNRKYFKMKKILLTIGAVASIMAISQSTNAQNVFKVRYESIADTTKTTGTGATPSQTSDILLYTHLDTEAGIDSFTYTWQIKALSLPTGWSVQGFCDNVICHTPATPMFESAYVTPNTGVGNNNTSKLYPWIHAPASTAVKGVAVMKLEVKTVNVEVTTGTPPSQTSELLYIIEKTTDATSINTISLDDQRLVVYPNPASGVVTVYADASLKATSALIADVMGRTIKTIDLNANQTIHTLDIAKLNAGIYNITIVNANGAVLNTKKLSVL
jgi:hypothetical protein